MGVIRVRVVSMGRLPRPNPHHQMKLAKNHQVWANRPKMLQLKMAIMADMVWIMPPYWKEKILSLSVSAFLYIGVLWGLFSIF